MHAPKNDLRHIKSIFIFCDVFLRVWSYFVERFLAKLGIIFKNPYTKIIFYDIIGYNMLFEARNRQILTSKAGIRHGAKKES